jgi:hypothetical protein
MTFQRCRVRPPLCLWMLIGAGLAVAPAAGQEPGIGPKASISADNLRDERNKRLF